VSVFVLILAHTTGKLVSIPFLLKTSPAALAAYLITSMAVFLGYKLARGDFQYWIPTAGTGVSLLGRIGGKLFSDFTGTPHFRHPFELGGLMWLFTLFEAQATCAASCIAYSRLYDGEDKIDDIPLFSSLAVLVGTWVLALGIFLLSINRSHLHTFISTQTGSQYVRRRFEHHAGNDELQMIVFTVHPALWRPIAADVEDWVGKKYTEMATKPWFTQAMAERIPDGMLPT
jgi:hypothetical protein